MSQYAVNACRGVEVQIALSGQKKAPPALSQGKTFGKS